MYFKAKLSERIRIDDVHEIIQLIHNNDSLRQELYNLLIDEDETIGFKVAWIFTHFSLEDNKWLYNKQDKLIDELLICKNAGKRRLILNLLYKQPLADPPRVDFLDFCLDRIISVKELPGVQSLCMKIAYELCYSIPELTQEFKTILEMMESDLCPAIRATRKNILIAMSKGKSLQKI